MYTMYKTLDMKLSFFTIHAMHALLKHV